MPETGRTISNHTMYVFAKEKYLKELLRSGRITQEQFVGMERFLYERFQVSSVDDFDIPIGDLVEQQPANSHSSESATTANKSVSTNSATVLQMANAEVEYVSLTDYAREYNPDNPGGPIQLWLQNRSTIEFLKLWELANNPQFQLPVCMEIQNRLRDNTFTLTAKYWIEQTSSIGLRSKAGRGGGTLAHPMIACDFLTGLSPYLKFLLIEMAGLRDILSEQAGDV